MIIVRNNEALTAQNLLRWYNEWKKDKARLYDCKYLYENRKDGKALLKIPFAKKLVTISASATAVGPTLSIPEELTDAQKALFEQIKEMFENQSIISQDRSVIKDGCNYGRGYELVFMSDDDVPIPKTAHIPATNAFVICDNTVERNSLYGVYFDKYIYDKTEYISFYIFDKYRRYEYVCPYEWTKDIKKARDMFDSEGTPHYLGRVPLTEYRNNDEEQGDYEQLIPLMHDRTRIHNLNIQDSIAIAKNYLKAKGTTISGTSVIDKDTTQHDMARSQRIEIPLGVEGNSYADEDSPLRDITLLSKNENYTSVTEFGKDIDGKIYDMSMIPDLTAEEFAGNQSGVALRLKLLAFKELVEGKDEEIEKLYRRRLKMYISALTYTVDTVDGEIIHSTSEAWFDAGRIKMTIVRSWWENIAELAQMIVALSATGLFSEQTLTEFLPNVSYDTEQERKEREATLRASRESTDPNNSSAEWLASVLARLGGTADERDEAEQQ